MGGPISPIVYDIGLGLGRELHDYTATFLIQDQPNWLTLLDAELSKPFCWDAEPALDYLVVLTDYSEHTIGFVLCHTAIPIDYWFTKLINLITKWTNSPLVILTVSLID